MPSASTTQETSRRRVPAAERRDALIEGARHEFAHGGLHGTPVDRIARRVGVAQPYVFALFGSKRDLFLAAVERTFQLVAERFAEAAEQFEPDPAEPEIDVLRAMGFSYRELLEEDRDLLMLQHQSFAASDDPVIRTRVRELYSGLIRYVEQISGASSERIDDFFRYGMWLNVAAALGVEDLSCASEWIQSGSDGWAPQSGGRRSG